MKKKVSYTVMNVLTLVGIVLTICALVGTPLVLTAFFKASEFNVTDPKAVPLITAGIYCCAAPYLVALFKLKKIGKIICGENAFSSEISGKFKDIAICAFAEAVIFIVIQIVACVGFKAFMLALTVVPTFIVPFVSVTGGFVALAFSDIFRKASEIKEENDLIF